MAVTPTPSVDHDGCVPAAPHSTLGVLVVDDDPGICTLLEVMFSLDARFTLAGIARNAAEARERASALDSAIDVMLLDVTLPDSNGIDLLEELRSTVPTSRFAMYTGWSDDPATITRATAAGADAIFRKDLAPPELLDGLARLCDPVADSAC